MDCSFHFIALSTVKWILKNQNLLKCSTKNMNKMLSFHYMIYMYILFVKKHVSSCSLRSISSILLSGHFAIRLPHFVSCRWTPHQRKMCLLLADITNCKYIQQFYSFARFSVWFKDYFSAGIKHNTMQLTECISSMLGTGLGASFSHKFQCDDIVVSTEKKQRRLLRCF